MKKLQSYREITVRLRKIYNIIREQFQEKMVYLRFLYVYSIEIENVNFENLKLKIMIKMSTNFKLILLKLCHALSL